MRWREDDVSFDSCSKDRMKRVIMARSEEKSCPCEGAGVHAGAGMQMLVISHVSLYHGP